MSSNYKNFDPSLQMGEALKSIDMRMKMMCKMELMMKMVSYTIYTFSTKMVKRFLISLNLV